MYHPFSLEGKRILVALAGLLPLNVPNKVPR